MLELRLLSNTLQYLIQPFPTHPRAPEVTAWSGEVPSLALKHDNVIIFGMFAFSASHLMRRQVGNSDLMITRQIYLALALREQQKAVVGLNISDTDSVCFTSLLLLIDSVAALSERNLQPYSPPMKWLRMGNGTGTVLVMAVESFRHERPLKMMLFINAPPVFDRKALFSDENMQPFSRLLNYQGPIEDLKARDAYDKTVRYIGCLLRSIEDDEPIHVFGRKIISFSIFIPKKFMDLVEQRQPRALVVLAHFFALMTKAQAI